METQPDHSNLPVPLTEQILEISHSQAQVALVNHRRAWVVEVQVKQPRVVVAAAYLILAIQVC
jgi:hypothetical protein